ncbi:MAG: tRNA (5-methylaminomethyl-2-thiouridine)(34)-methyltransferase MnmD [Bacteroidetes bacterium]|jgi:tRNA U34 5-methylaminomethyl-2-thiouridine-forming methyltransferase MnmC|nr:tRNA (5-methylaminomethyl-2-thiouridine)(34)-methyltransferase MnmD [Bacteroidota bacterium]MBT3750263.1 tRNA (5-methylaminomethyl-2-thiouridine)(34)-methyltransferase MnmD [Bacteroidota bacterium]MBT4400458.1 tRNA (5-methylaminomethyl-2-thiouridine)(34)-methyltransferase MnmD [Bacteroidota bacterium]MBT4410340.1 tRNA (5-methylaminomethyl-2-thiouridine)(34)-methyltransferase MnmD [Bacteroidota bacterium]MBT5425632.1 tRNA (5-methylaminomethyl-2-thiouridine)(34)-methyltransferase MnmD [Bactero
MDRKLFVTEDGSHSLKVEGLDETYHSKHGAIQESEHVFIQKGLDNFAGKHIRILELGFGTGLNAFLTYIATRNRNLNVLYTTIEKYPLAAEEYEQLNYPALLKQSGDAFLQMHTSGQDKTIEISGAFHFRKIIADCHDLSFKNNFDLVYYDAFGPEVQPDLWEFSTLKLFYNALVQNGQLVTYSAKGQVRRNLKECGFTVERIEGPPGKREMLRACK